MDLSAGSHFAKFKAAQLAGERFLRKGFTTFKEREKRKEVRDHLEALGNAFSDYQEQLTTFHTTQNDETLASVVGSWARVNRFIMLIETAIGD